MHKAVHIKGSRKEAYDMSALCNLYYQKALPLRGSQVNDYKLLLITGIYFT